MSGYGKGGFGGGFGGNQMQQLMKQAQKMQEEMKNAQSALDDAEVEGSSGGGMVTVVMNGKKIIKSINIKPEAVDPDDVEMLEDLVVAAVNDAYAKADKVYEEKMGKFGSQVGGLF